MDIKETPVNKKRISPREVTRQLTLIALSASLTCGKLPFGAYPFGFAALGAARGLDVLGVSVGLLLTLGRSGSPFINLGAYVLTLTLRAIFSLIEGKGTRAFCERISLSSVASTTGAFALGAYVLVTHELLYYHLFGLIISVAVTSAATPLWSAISSRASLNCPSALRYISYLSLICAVSFSLRELHVYGISLSVFACALFTLLAARHSGASAGGVVGGVSGLCVSVIFAPSFAFCGTVCGILLPLSPLLAVSLGVVVAIAWGAYINGILAFISLFPALLSAAVIFYVVNRLYLSEIWQSADTSSQQTQKILSGDVALIRLDSTGSRLRRLCQGLSRLSCALAVDGEGTPDKAPFEEIGGELSSEEYAGYINDILQCDFPQLDYKSVADYLSQIMSDTGKDPFIDAEMSKRLTDLLMKRFDRQDIRAIYHGKERTTVTVLCDSESFLRRRCEEISLCISDTSRLKLDFYDVREIDGRAYINLFPRPMLSVSVFGKKKNASAEDSFCGDSFGVADGAPSGRFFAYISDGMGSGREAARTSRLCSAFLGELLPVCGAPVDNTLAMLNGFLRSKNNVGVMECAATVDLCELDLVGCRAAFYKCGAAPTYVFRDGSLFKLRCRTVPIGIMPEHDVGRVDMELMTGDVIVMVSDGVTQGKEEYPELFEYLHARLLTHNAEQLADAVVDFAVSQGSADDISAVVIKVGTNVVR